VLAQHLQDTPTYARQIDDEFVELIYQTSPLHDIGKVAISDLILLKPGRLTAEEFEIMKTHTTHGAETLDAVLSEFPGAPFLEMARDIALGHHERFDGGGYPRGLKGTSIPLSARIMAVADVYDALTTRRVYKGPYSHQRAQGMIAAESATHFDPDVVAAFLAKELQFAAIREQYDGALIPVPS
jgi:putative two-component system response regulator